MSVTFPSNAAVPLGARVVIMGVSGSGKSSVGRALGERLSMPYLDGDDYHPQTNIDKMSRGEPLDDIDRADWLDRIAQRIAQARTRGEALMIGCSALKRHYRDRLRQADPELVFVFLDGSFTLILERMRQRRHFFSPAMLESQFATLEAPDATEALRLDISLDFDQLIDQGTVDLRRRCNIEA